MSDILTYTERREVWQQMARICGGDERLEQYASDIVMNGNAEGLRRLNGEFWSGLQNKGVTGKEALECVSQFVAKGSPTILGSKEEKQVAIGA